MASEQPDCDCYFIRLDGDHYPDCSKGYSSAAAEPEVIHEWEDIGQGGGCGRIDDWRVTDLGFGDMRLEARRKGKQWIFVSLDPVDVVLMRELTRLAARVRELEHDLAPEYFED